MARTTSRTPARSRFGELVRKAAGRTPANRISLEAEAAQLAAATAFGPAGNPPPAVETAMAAQGMDTSSLFSPGRPMQQFLPWGSPAWAWDRPAGYNIATRPRATGTRASFGTLRSLIASYDVARMCIEHRQDDVRALDWTIVAADGVHDDVSEQVELARKLMAKPDGRTPFDSWQNSFLEDVLAYDAGCLYRGRLRSGQVGGLEVVDGTTIAPLLDYEGRSPQGEAPAFVQYVAGVPALWLLEQDLIYQPFRLQPNSPYGLAPIEWMLLAANTDIRFQLHFLQFFTEGTVPEGFMEAPADFSSPDQLIAFQAAWDEIMEGDQAQKHRIRWVPAGANYKPARDTPFDEAFPMFLLRKTCAAFKVKPTDLGFTDNANRSTSDVQDDVQRRVGRRPLLKYLAGIYTRYLQDDHGLPVKFQFDTGEEREDRLAQAQEWKVWIEAGVAGVDEPREKILGLPVDADNPVPRFIVTRSGVEPLKSIMSIAGEIDPETMAPPAGSITYEDDLPEPVVADDEPVKVPGPQPDEPAAPPADQPTPPPPPPPAPAPGKVAKADADVPPAAAMVALMLPAAAAAELAVPGGLPAEDLHITLAYLGDGLTPGQVTEAGRAVARVAAVWAPVEGRVSGTGTFVDGDGGPAVTYASYDAPGLGALREAVVDALAHAGLPVATEHGFTPHISLTYADTVDSLPAQLPIEFRELTLAVGPLRLPYRLAGEETGVDQALIVKELRRWRDQARRRVSKGLAARPWVGELIPPSTTADVWAVLAEATSREQVDAAFADALWQPQG